MPGPSEDRMDSRKRNAVEDRKMISPTSKKKRFSPESELRFNLETCSKGGDVAGALEVYDRAKHLGSPKLNQYHYNLMLYLCSSASLGATGRRSQNETSDEVKDGDILFRGHMAALVKRSSAQEAMEMAQRRGLEIFEQMKADKVPLNEAAFTSLARLAVAKRDGDLAFQIVKDMLEAGIVPRLRSYGPALYTYFANNQVDRAFEVDEHMVAANVQPEEMELEMLLDLSARANLQDKVYAILHRLRASVRSVSISTANTVERWFRSEAATTATGGPFQREAAQDALEMRGGGGHELGWVGKGGWKVKYPAVEDTGTCEACGETLATVDLDVQETVKFCGVLEALACGKERDRNNFREFQKWLEAHGPFEAIVDGANVALYNQNYSAGGFSFAQLDSVVTKLQELHGKLPLILLHQRRTTGGPASADEAQELIKRWSEANALYTTPTGSNDDWYWLYAAVKLKCLLVSNDEMRDHLFQTLGTQFFPRWKERHQVHFDFPNAGLDFRMPPPYSVVIQESARGTWHFPVQGEKDATQWLCAAR